VPRRKSVAQKSGAKGLAKKDVVRALGTQVRRLRLDRRLSQEEIAELAGINPKYLGRVELGKSDPGAYVLVRLAGAFRVPIGELFETIRAAGSADSTTLRLSPADVESISDALAHLTTLVNRLHARKPEPSISRAPRRSRR
jgi:transcriptional regulator with XRE-family HTH domain